MPSTTTPTTATPTKAASAAPATPTVQAAPAPAAPAPTATPDAGGWQAPEDPTPPPDAGAATAPWTRMPGWVIALLVFAVLGGFGWMVTEAWRFVVHNTDPTKQQEWEQLRGLIDLVNGIVLLVVGTVLGVSVQGRQSAQLAAAARDQARAAGDLHRVAQRNASAARANAAVARVSASRAEQATVHLRRAELLLDQVRGLVHDRDADDTRFVTARSLHPARRDDDREGGQLRLDPTGPTTVAVVADTGVDRTLTRIADQADDALAQIRAFLSAPS